MTTEELKKELEELGLTLKINSNSEGERWVNIVNEFGVFYAAINLTREYVADIYATIFEDSEKQRKLFNAVTEYAATPIEERDPKRYFRYRLKRVGINTLVSDYSELYLKIEDELACDLCKKDELDNTTGRTTFEENDPLLELAHLEVFEPIEVDVEGNEIHD